MTNPSEIRYNKVDVRCPHCKYPHSVACPVEFAVTTREPVSVSLEGIADIVFKATKNQFTCKELAKAVLDAAGVKYVD